MGELIKIDNENRVDGRELHEFLQVGTAYKDWFPRMVEYGFIEGVDFCSKMSESTGGRPAVNHSMTIDMAKEISMIQRNERGKQARQYFIACEKRLKMLSTPSYQITDPIARAQAWIEEEKKRQLLQAQNEEMKPKALFADAVSSSRTSILIRDLAKLVKQNGVDMGQNRLFSWLRENGYLIKSGSDKNMPTQRSMDMSLFEIQEGNYTDGGGRNCITRTTKVTGKGQVYFINKLVKQERENKIV